MLKLDNFVILKVIDVCLETGVNRSEMNISMWSELQGADLLLVRIYRARIVRNEFPPRFRFFLLQNSPWNLFVNFFEFRL